VECCKRESATSRGCSVGVETRESDSESGEKEGKR
jgi:hypothetical protein